ncbi:hypothetical protein D3C87_2190430 [compost metagenome]
MPLGFSSSITTVCASGALTLLTLVRPLPSNSGRQRHCVLGSMSRFQLHSTSLAVNGSPLWNFTPSRKVKV